MAGCLCFQEGGGNWSCTKGYSQADLAALDGGRWEAYYIETYGSGDGWRDAVMEKVGSGDHALICVTKLMQHTIDGDVHRATDVSLIEVQRL